MTIDHQGTNLPRSIQSSMDNSLIWRINRGRYCFWKFVHNLGGLIVPSFPGTRSLTASFASYDRDHRKEGPGKRLVTDELSQDDVHLVTALSWLSVDSRCQAIDGRGKEMRTAARRRQAPVLSFADISFPLVMRLWSAVVERPSRRPSA